MDQKNPVYNISNHSLHQHHELWEVFKWANEQYKGFKHLPQSCEAMALLLVHVGMLREAEFLLCKIESQGISLDSHKIFSNLLIEAYVGEDELERAIIVYDQMRGQGLVPSMMCCCVLDILVRKKKIQLAYQVCWDMLKMNVNLSGAKKASLENVIRLLCRDGKIQEGRNLVKRAVVSSLEPSY